MGNTQQPATDEIKPAQTFGQFKRDVQEARALAEQYPDTNGNTLHICIHYPTQDMDGPMDPLFGTNWSKVSTVLVTKLKKDGTVASRKIINFFQFYKLFSAMELYAPKGELDELSLRQSSEAVTQKLKEMDDGDKDCVICMERPAEISLGACHHEFCEKCIKEWTQKQHTCPICRRDTETGDGDWTLTAQDTKEGIGDYFIRFLNSL